MPKVSVVVPVYGVEKYIERCARSLFEQTLEDMEFVFVDDCTKDNSIAILEKVIQDYPKRKDQLKIIHHEQNKGLSHARETGVKNATGDFIGHCDSDDWVAKEMYEEMYSYAISGEYDFVKCGFRKTDQKTIDEINTVYTASGGIIDSLIAVDYLLKWKGWNSIWDTLIRADLYRKTDIQYTNNSMLEDFFVVSQLLSYANKIGVVDKPFYNYYVNPQSICNTPSVDSFIDRTIQAKANMDWILTSLKKRYNIKKSSELTAKWGVKNILIPVMDTDKGKEYWKQIYPGLNSFEILIASISMRNKLRFIAADLHLYKFFKRR